ncbi:MarR family transcriptional regulator [Thermobifida alba]|uniref:MarR family transcriptional regulator n=1 Tax=Thermobifida alba TaxID=53522 RepID=A0ABY4L2X4_THEAE|nr:MarR family transcriptional regulator [Thermobifida alba]UPT20402.1 MarR family transcriptional regulator [Thermobifida alba]HLU98437.1 MarR family transcriptional regulator [Thermobifida alba]
MSGTTGDEDAFRSDFVRRFAEYWQSQGRPKAEGRIVGYLLLSDSGGVSATQIADGAQVSRGSVSTAVRRLEELGFVRQVRVTGQRHRLVAMDDDVWGNFLRNERRYLRQQRDLAQAALDRLGDGLSAAGRSRLVNMRDYMVWLDGYHDTLLAHWEAHKARRDAAAARG